MRYDDRRRYRPELIDIDHDEPLPILRAHISEWRKLFLELQIGDSFFIPAETPADINAARNNTFDALRRSLVPINLTGRKEQYGIRFWRLEDDAQAGMSGDPYVNKERRSKKQ